MQIMVELRMVDYKTEARGEAVADWEQGAPEDQEGASDRASGSGSLEGEYPLCFSPLRHQGPDRQPEVAFRNSWKAQWGGKK